MVVWGRMADTSEGPNLPIACSLSTPELRLRERDVRDRLARYLTGAEDLEDGIALRLAPADEVLADAEAFVDFERRCCGFATFALRREDEGDGLWIEIRGPEGTKTFFEELLQNVRPAP